MKTWITVLVAEWVTGGGMAGADLPPSWAAEGSAMRRAIASDFASVPGVHVLMTLDARLPDEPGPWTTLRIGCEQESTEWARHAAESDWTVLIAPETGGTLADCSRTLALRGGRSLGSTPEAIELAGDKLRLAAHLSERGIRTPVSRRVVPSRPLPSDVSYPAVLKPIDGAGSLDTFLIPEPALVPDDAKALPEAILQPYLPGIPSSATFLIGPENKARLIGIGRQRMEIQEGRFVYRGGILPDHEASPAPVLAQAVESIPGLRGWVGVDFLRDEDNKTVTILEINPRPTTSIVGLARILPPGLLAKAWIDTVEGTHAQADWPLEAIVRSKNSVTFDTDGTIDRMREREASRD
ncbi:ATP-grasp domain-containing protein [Singulisphaera acidiphila]|uniref:Putative ATP-utilizing enzyme (ATP-grasp superfamily) n=1 Tax=Singulisphaera acidiphila (strain ATCC BAA-1392 / DSM 18658 / VKM B-2454 / MOB10) TaxID=886293 RepID=L0DAC5_SINAD|nr:ATP-grasp domain-containing protein [Singulisphaera acidiphila]AGA25606.1 putative ATP-utilizing enzyme (ATP-grasp superfamily) [Singulisphaera acidiphila DSM 18658]